jgi:hypothetical protein
MCPLGGEDGRFGRTDGLGSYTQQAPLLVEKRRLVEETVPEGASAALAINNNAAECALRAVGRIRNKYLLGATPAANVPLSDTLESCFELDTPVWNNCHSFDLNLGTFLQQITHNNYSHRRIVLPDNLEIR